MKLNDVLQLNPGDKVDHKHYGVCTVQGFVPDFGPTIIPDTKEGKDLLSSQTGMPDTTPLLETSFRLLKKHSV